MPRRAASLTAALSASSALLLSGCADDPEVTTTPPGLAPPPCAMGFTAYRVDRLTLPETTPVTGIDLDGDPADPGLGVDNQLGQLHAMMAEITESWNVNPAIAGHLDGRALHWVLEVGRCLDGGDHVRVHLSRARDLDRDGVLELVDRGVAAVGTRGPRLATELGIAAVPLGFLTDGGGSYATDAWQAGFALATDLAEEPDGSLRGLVGFALGRFRDDALAPLAAYATGTLGEGTSTSDFWRIKDRDRDGVISSTEVRTVVEQLIRPDLDLGACDELACYQLDGDDGERDRYSVGLDLHAVPVTLE